jgi:hypothetical protein
VEIAHLEDGLYQNVLPETINAYEVQSIIKADFRTTLNRKGLSVPPRKQYELAAVLKLLPISWPNSTCVYNFTTTRDPTSFLGTPRTFSASGPNLTKSHVVGDKAFILDLEATGEVNPERVDLFSDALITPNPVFWYKHYHKPQRLESSPGFFSINSQYTGP